MRVDHLALLVHHLVVFQDVLADLRVAPLDGVLRPLDRLGHHLRLDGHVFWKGLGHHPAHGPGGEETHEVVLEAEEEAALAGVTLPARASPQLVVDSAALVALTAEDVQPAERPDLVTLESAALVELAPELRQLGGTLLGVEVDPLGHRLVPGQELGVPAEDDVDAASGHVGGHRHRSEPPGLGDHLGLPEVLFRVQYLVADSALGQQARQELGLGHRGGADEDRLPALVAFDDVLDHRRELRLLALEHEVGRVGADEREVGRDGHHRERVGTGELARFGLGGPGHAGELLVQPEVVLERHRRPGVVLLFDPDALLRFDRLVETVRPSPALEGATRELVDDLHLALVDEVVLVPVVQLLGPEGLGQLVDVVDRHRVVEVRHPHLLLDLLDPRLKRDDDLLLLVDLVVVVALEVPDDRRELVVQLGRLVGGTRDDERRAGLVDQDRVDLVDDAEDVAPLHHQLGRARHVVAQVVEPELGVGAVGDVAVVGGTLLVGVVDVRAHAADGEPEPPVQLAHPARVAGGQVVVHGHDVDAPAREGVQVDRHRRHQRLALAGLHLGDPAEVQGHPAHQLDVEGALPEDPPRPLPDHREGLDEEIVQALAPVEPLLELDGAVAERLVGEALHLLFEGVDHGHELGQTPNLLALAGPEDLGQHTHGFSDPTWGVVPNRCETGAAAVGLRAADLVFDPTPACCGAGGPGVGGLLGPSTPATDASPRLRRPPTVGGDGQDLPLNRTMLSNHELPYVGRFACDWPRLSTTDPHAARHPC